MLYCQSSPDDHRAAAIYALSFARQCGHLYPTRTLACLQHGAESRARPRGAESTACERCGERSALTLVRIEDVFEERVVIRVLRGTLEASAHSPVTFAYDRAYRNIADRGMEPVSTYRTPVEWRSASPATGLGNDILEACVTMAVTVPVHGSVDKAG
jgi:hypothetical protein